MADDLPPGFTLDRSDDPPPGFVVDRPAPTGTQTGSIVRGIPIIGPYLDKGVAAVAAAPAAVLPGEGYTAMYNRMIAGQDRYEKENPIASTVGQTAGSVLATVPAARAFPRVFGGASTPGQMASGAAIGGADAAVRSGGDLDAIKTGTLIGGAAPIIGSILAPAGQAIASGARAIADRTPGIRNVIARKVAPPPNAEIFDAAERGYDTLSRGGVTYSTPHLGDLNTLIRHDIHAGSVGTPRSASRTITTLDDNIANLPPNPSSLHTTRKELQTIINEAGPASPDGRAALIAKNHIDNFMEAPPPNAVRSGNFDAATVGQRLRDANANYRAAMTDQELREQVARGVATNNTQAFPFLSEGAATRKAVANLQNDRKTAKFRLPNEDEALRDVTRSGSLGERGLRLLSGATGSGRINIPVSLTGTLAALGLGSTLGPAVPLTLGAAGLGASAATTGLTRRAVEKASNTIRANAPYAQAQMRRQVYQPQIPGAPYTPWKTSISDKAHRDEIARLLALQAERETTER